MDKYTKSILTIIAIGIIGINLQMFGNKIITPAHAASIPKVQICDSEGDCAQVTMGGRFKVQD